MDKTKEHAEKTCSGSHLVYTLKQNCIYIPREASTFALFTPKYSMSSFLKTDLKCHWNCSLETSGYYDYIAHHAVNKSSYYNLKSFFRYINRIPMMYPHIRSSVVGEQLQLTSMRSHHIYIKLQLWTLFDMFVWTWLSTSNEFLLLTYNGMDAPQNTN